MAPFWCVEAANFTGKRPKPKHCGRETAWRSRCLQSLTSAAEKKQTRFYKDAKREKRFSCLRFSASPAWGGASFVCLCFCYPPPAVRRSCLVRWVVVPLGWREQGQGWHGSEPLSRFLKPSLSTSARAGAASSSGGLARCCHRRCFSTAAGLSPDALLPPCQRCRPRYGNVPGHKRGMKSWEVSRPKLVSADRPLLTVPLLGLEVDEDFEWALVLWCRRSMMQPVGRRSECCYLDLILRILLVFGSCAPVKSWR